MSFFVIAYRRGPNLPQNVHVIKMYGFPSVLQIYGYFKYPIKSLMKF